VLGLESSRADGSYDVKLSVLDLARPDPPFDGNRAIA